MTPDEVPAPTPAPAPAGPPTPPPPPPPTTTTATGANEPEPEKTDAEWWHAYERREGDPLPRADRPRSPEEHAQRFADTFASTYEWFNSAPPIVSQGLGVVLRDVGRVLRRLFGAERGERKEDCAIILERGDEEVVEIRHKATTLHDLADKAQRVVAALDDPPSYEDCFGRWTCPPETVTFGGGINVGVRASPMPGNEPPPGSDPYGPDAPPPAVPGAPDHPLP